MKQLKELANVLEEHNLLKKLTDKDLDLDILDLTYDSRQARDGSLFFCKGQAFKPAYLDMAMDLGASAYVSEIDYDVNIPGLIVSDIRKAMLVLAKYFFDQPDEKLKIVGITATKGKTTTVKFLKSILDADLKSRGKKPAGLISTVNVYDGMQDVSAKLTTPEAITLYRYLDNAVKSGLSHMIIEVSSQALKYDRVTNVSFDIGAFLNIGQDHVSEFEHPSHQDYFQSKLTLANLSKEFIYNLDMDQVDQVEAYLSQHKIPANSYSLNNTNADLYAQNIQRKGYANHFDLFVNGQLTNFQLNYPGDYNIENAIVALMIASMLGASTRSMQIGLREAVVEGRDNLYLTDDEKILAWVSYAHNGLSFQKSYDVINENYKDYYKIAVFGGAGDRDISRLIDSANIAGKYSDYIIAVPDDPGSLSHETLSKQIMAIVDGYDKPCESYGSRPEGIERAFDLAKKQDGQSLIFIAGKGSDDYMLLDGKHVPIQNDLISVKKALEKYNS